MQQKYKDETEADCRTTTGLTSAITARIEAKRQKLTTAFTKYLPVANPHNGDTFLSEVLLRIRLRSTVIAASHISFDKYSSITIMEYSLMLIIMRISDCKTLVRQSCSRNEHREVAALGEKLQLLATSCIPGTEKEEILRIWNSPKSTRVAKRFPVPPFSDTNFATYLHRYVFWYQLKAAALNLLPSLLDEVRCSDKQPSRSFVQYIDFSKSCHWEYAFSEQIKSKEINKFVDWESPKNTYKEGAMRRLIYRYWMHMLLSERVALEESPNLVDWLDPKSDEFMYTSKQEESWSNPHLKLYHWYVEMPKDGTPLHEEDNHHSAEPSFARSNAVAAPKTVAADTVTNRQSARATKGRQIGSVAKGANSSSKVNNVSKGGS